MKITFATHLLADDARLMGATGLAVSAAEQAQTLRAIRAEWLQRIARGGKSLSITFSVTRRHATLDDAQDFLLQHPSSLPHQGDAVFEIGQPGDAATLTLPAALLTVASSTLDGAATTHAYALAGPALVET